MDVEFTYWREKDDRHYRICGYGKLVTDHHYGADADGRRGMKRSWVEILNYLIFDNMGLPVSKNIFDAKETEEIEAQITKEIERN